jgi:hypothetical protein
MPDLQGIFIHGIGWGTLFCLGLVLAIQYGEKWLGAKRGVQARLAKRPSDNEIPGLLSAVDNSELPLAEKVALLQRIRMRNDPGTALELLKIFTKDHPTQLRREILRAVWSVDRGVWTTTLLLEVVKSRGLAMMLRLDAAEILLHTGSEAGIGAIRHLLRLQGESVQFKVRILRLLEWSTDPRAIPVVLSGLRCEDADVSALAQSVIRRMAQESGVKGELLRGGLVQGLHGSISRIRQATHRLLPLQQLIEVEEAADAAYPTEGTAKLLRKLLESAEPDDNTTEAVAAMAAEGLGRLGVEEAIPALKRCLYGSSEGVRYAAVEALGRLGAADAIPEMGFVASHEQLRRIRQAAVDASTPIPRRRHTPLPKF